MHMNTEALMDKIDNKCDMSNKDLFSEVIFFLFAFLIATLVQTERLLAEDVVAPSTVYKDWSLKSSWSSWLRHGKEVDPLPPFPCLCPIKKNYLKFNQ